MGDTPDRYVRDTHGCYRANPLALYFLEFQQWKSSLTKLSSDSNFSTPLYLRPFGFLRSALCKESRIMKVSVTSLFLILRGDYGARTTC